MRSQLHVRLEKACHEDNTIVVRPEEAHLHPGFSTDYLESLGISKMDLKLLERIGFAYRGYTKNVWLPGETMPNGKSVPNDEDSIKHGLRFHGPGHRVRWILVAPEKL